MIVLFALFVAKMLKWPSGFKSLFAPLTSLNFFHVGHLEPRIERGRNKPRKVSLSSSWCDECGKKMLVGDSHDMSSCHTFHLDYSSAGESTSCSSFTFLDSLSLFSSTSCDLLNLGSASDSISSASILHGCCLTSSLVIAQDLSMDSAWMDLRLCHISTRCHWGWHTFFQIAHYKLHQERWT